ncbi:zinc transporter ZIP1-like [Mya arenaria]|uniref:zinc transporter ZIP1-like n=1 Tax=Mya arenaria TaxID=6604 RepID=UPI0022E56A1D|nr:zinc transporter ZIP1-like [Mya arenaria]XP_052812265.1 zinc transporter ZIP1-like [Mya arenaria]
MNVIIVKVLVLVGLLVLTFVFGIIPVILKNVFKKRADTESHKSRYRTILSFLSCYAAGVFLATGVLDLLPDVRVSIGTTFDDISLFTSFPVAEFVMMFGFFVILIIEQIVLCVKEGQTQSNQETERKPLLTDDEPESSVRDYYRSTSNASEHSIGGISDEPFSHSFPGTPSRRHCSNCEERISVASDHHISRHEDPGDDILPEHEHSSLRALLLILALSFHSVFEGLAVGLQKKTEDVIGIFGALVIHKSILSFCLGMNLIESRLSQAGIIRSIVFFSITAPIGIGIGIGIMDLWDSNNSLLVQGILSGIACGTFLYVTFFEVLPSEFNCPDHRLLKVLFLILGFATVTCVLFLDKDNGPTCYVKPQ